MRGREEEKGRGGADAAGWVREKGVEGLQELGEKVRGKVLYEYMYTSVHLYICTYVPKVTPSGTRLLCISQVLHTLLLLSFLSLCTKPLATTSWRTRQRR